MLNSSQKILNAINFFKMVLKSWLSSPHTNSRLKLNLIISIFKILNTEFIRLSKYQHSMLKYRIQLNFVTNNLHPPLILYTEQTKKKTFLFYIHMLYMANADYLFSLL